jgi:hypothetical protein
LHTLLAVFEKKLKFLKNLVQISKNFDFSQKQQARCGCMKTPTGQKARR